MKCKGCGKEMTLNNDMANKGVRIWHCNYDNCPIGSIIEYIPLTVTQ